MTLAEVLRTSGKNDFRGMSRVVDDLMSSGEYESIVAHDIGVTITMLALMARFRKGRSVPKKAVFFNGAFSEFDVFAAPHPVWIQLKSWKSLARDLLKSGVTMDPQLQEHFSTIKKVYRQIIIASVVQKFASPKSPDQTKVFLPSLLILEGIDDPYIPERSIRALEKFSSRTVRIITYSGHFPYLGPVEKIRALISEYENEAN